MDPRCLEHDHDFDEREIYDEEGSPLPPRQQFYARCRRCGITLAEGLQCMISDLEVQQSGNIN